jgi:hypothetical protein
MNGEPAPDEMSDNRHYKTEDEMRLPFALIFRIGPLRIQAGLCRLLATRYYRVYINKIRGQSVNK